MPRGTPGADTASEGSRVALVTGGSRGIGRGIAEGLARSGHRVAIVSREPLTAVEEMKGSGLEVLAISSDLEVEDPAAAVATCLDELGRIDIFVHSAAANVRRSAFEMDMSQWRSVQYLNVDVGFSMARDCALDMRTRNWGRVVFVTSIQAVQGGYSLPITAYGAAKSGLTGLARGLAKEWGPLGIRVNCLAPGFVKTDRNVGLREDPELVADTLRRIPVGRWADVKDMVAPTLLLCSDGADYITGQTLFVDGGWLVR